MYSAWDQMPIAEEVDLLAYRDPQLQPFHAEKEGEELPFCCFRQHLSCDELRHEWNDQVSPR
jgi:hypothetical protein